MTTIKHLCDSLKNYGIIIKSEHILHNIDDKLQLNTLI